MKILKAFKFRLKTNPQIQGQLARTGGSVRFVWNQGLALQKKLLEEKRNILSYGQLCRELTDWKKDSSTSWLGESPSQALQQTLKNLSRALKDAFDKTNLKKFPRFKKKGFGDSFLYPQGFQIRDNRVFLPKIGWLNFWKSREIEGIPKNITVSQKGGHWYISIQSEIEVKEPTHPSTRTVGIDLGVARFATLSDGTFYDPKNSFRKLEENLAKEQKKLSRKKKFSKNWIKQKKRISRLHHHIANARNDYLHKVSTAISKNHVVVVLEDLLVGNMSKSAKGTLEEPGRNVKAKSGLNKAILDQGWYEFRRQLEYKQLWRGGIVVVVPPQYTSQTCPECGHVSKENRVSQSVFHCESCGKREHADLVGAINILAIGLDRVGLWIESHLRGRKQEPVGNREAVPLLG